MNTLLIRLIAFAISYFVASLALFGMCCLAVPGFPFFPQSVFRSNTDNSAVKLKRGGYYVLFYTEGTRPLSVVRGDVGEISLSTGGQDDSKQPVQWKPSNFYFDDAPDGDGVRGHSVAYFFLPSAAEVRIVTHCTTYGYKGFIIRTGFGGLLLAMAIYEVVVILLAIGGAKAVLYRIRKRRPLPPLTHSLIVKESVL